MHLLRFATAFQAIPMSGRDCKSSDSSDLIRVGLDSDLLLDLHHTVAVLVVRVDNLGLGLAFALSLLGSLGFLGRGRSDLAIRRFIIVGSDADRSRTLSGRLGGRLGGSAFGRRRRLIGGVDFLLQSSPCVAGRANGQTSVLRELQVLGQWTRTGKNSMTTGM
jgi:hypothetical protein